jgi:hypothetical protein
VHPFLENGFSGAVIISSAHGNGLVEKIVTFPYNLG